MPVASVSARSQCDMGSQCYLRRSPLTNPLSETTTDNPMRFYGVIVAAGPILALHAIGAGPHRFSVRRWVVLCNSRSPSFADPRPDSGLDGPVPARQRNAATPNPSLLLTAGSHDRQKPAPRTSH
jgi:hypothetical protein